MKSTSGFTLIELAVAVSLAGVLLAAGAPGFQNLIRQNRVTVNANQFLAGLNLARSEAIKRGQTVTMCKADLSGTTPACDASTCDESSGAHCWEKGWLVFSDSGTIGVVDDDGDANLCEPDDDTDCVIHVFEALPKDFAIRGGAHVEHWVGYEGTGRVKGDGGPVNDTIKLCLDGDVATGRQIIISPSGRPRVTNSTGSCS